MKKKLFIIPIVLLALWGYRDIWFNLVTYSGYYAKHLPHKKGTNPELIFTLKNLYYLEKPNNLELRYDYDGVNTIVVNEKYSLSDYTEPEVLLFTKGGSSIVYYDFDKQGKFLFKEILDYPDSPTDNSLHSESEKSMEEAEAYVDRAIQPILEVQPKPKLNLQWLFNLIYQGKFD